MTRPMIKSKNPKCWLVVDALNLSFRYKHKRITEFTEDYIRTVKSLANSYSAGQIIILSDKGSSVYRKTLLPSYKGNREEKFKDQTEQEKLEMEEFFEGYERTLAELEKLFPVFRYKGVEADDLAAYICKKREALGIEKIWLVSSDRDWDLMIDENISRFSYVTRKEITAANWEEHYDVTPEEYISYKCLMGDDGDNVMGVEGIGPKRATDLIKTYGSALDIIDELPIKGTAKYIFNLNQSRDLILLNYQLMDLISYCEDAIGDNLADFDERLKLI